MNLQMGSQLAVKQGLSYAKNFPNRTFIEFISLVDNTNHGANNHGES